MGDGSWRLESKSRDKTTRPGPCHVVGHHVLDLPCEQCREHACVERAGAVGSSAEQREVDKEGGLRQRGFAARQDHLVPAVTVHRDHLHCHHTATCGCGGKLRSMPRATVRPTLRQARQAAPKFIHPRLHAPTPPRTHHAPTLPRYHSASFRGSTPDSR